MGEENLNKKFEEEFNKLSEKDKKEVNNLIRFMQEKKYHDSQYEELLNQYIELSRDYEKSQDIIKEVREKVEMKIKEYKNIINTLIYSSVENKRYEINELKYRIGEQEELLDILDKERESE